MRRLFLLLLVVVGCSKDLDNQDCPDGKYPAGIDSNGNREECIYPGGQ